ncbi:MAG TPA: type II secretion system protein [Gammaproteobacteria bacterium]|jgi:prepilin-type N-terminal cleavage/methylation domain-containing protein
MSARGFTLIELLVVVIIVGIMAGLALDRLLPLIGRAQRAAFLQVQSELRSALLLEAAERLTRGQDATLPELAGVNPMTLLLEVPGNYLGTLDAVANRALPRASWFYDPKTARLVYTVGRYTRFAAREGPTDRIELAVKFAFEDRDGNGAYDAAVDDFAGLRLIPVHAYDWPD